jgi:hypothetical protein
MPRVYWARDDNRVGRNPTASSGRAITLIPKDRLSKQFRRAIEMELFLNPRAIGLHRFHAYVKFLGNPARFQSPSEHAEDLQLAVTQSIGR